MQELDELEKAVKEKFARRQTLPVMKYEVFSSSVLKSVKGVSSKPSNPLVIQVQSGSNSVACPEGQVAIVRPGQGSELERSVCGEMFCRVLKLSVVGIKTISSQGLSSFPSPRGRKISDPGNEVGLDRRIASAT